MKGIKGTKYIYKKSDGGYSIHKRVDGKLKYYAHGRTLIEILMKRDMLEANDWDKDKVAFIPSYIYIIPNGSFMIQKKINGKIYHFGTFKEYDDAVDERDLLKTNQWDWDLICEEDERDDGKIIFLNKLMY